MGVMYYAEYFHLFERARSEFIRQRGISYAEVEKRGVLLPVRDASCRYRSPCRYDDLVWIQIGVSALGRASISFVYKVWNENKERLHAEGATQHALVNGEGRPIRMPDWFRALIVQP